MTINLTNHEAIDEIKGLKLSHYRDFSVKQQCALGMAIDTLTYTDNKTRDKLLKRLQKFDSQTLSVALLYAVNFTKYGADVTTEWTTAAQQNANLERARMSGFQEASERYSDILSILESKQDDVYQKGLNDAWECARKIIRPTGYSFAQLQEAFSLSSLDCVCRIFEDFSASEAIAKIKEYEEENHDD